MKIRVLYEENIKNGYKVYTTIEVPDGDYTVMLDVDYNKWHNHYRYQGNYKGQNCEDDGTEYGGEGRGVWSEPLMSEVVDDRVFRKDKIVQDEKDTDEANRQFIRRVLNPEIAEIFIATKYEGLKIRDYAKKIAKSKDEAKKIENNLTQKLKRAAQKLASAYPEKGF